MSFWPFPKTLLEALREGAARGLAVDLGAGSGDFARQLRRIHVETILLDRARVGRIDGLPAVRADSTRLPFAASSLGLLTNANHLRHLSDPQLRAQMDETLRCVRPGGRQVVLEDDPRPRNAAEENYRRTLRLLARVSPGRGEACGSERVVQPAVASGWEVLDEGGFENELEVREPLLPLDWLRNRVDDAAFLDEVRQLEEDVRRWGMTYGRAWFLVLGKEA